MTNTPGTLSMKYVNHHARLCLNSQPDPIKRESLIKSLRGVNDTDRARIRVRIEQILADR